MEDIIEETTDENNDINVEIAIYEYKNVIAYVFLQYLTKQFCNISSKCITEHNQSQNSNWDSLS